MVTNCNYIQILYLLRTLITTSDHWSWLRYTEVWWTFTNIKSIQLNCFDECWMPLIISEYCNIKIVLNIVWYVMWPVLCRCWVSRCDHSDWLLIIIIIGLFLLSTLPGTLYPGILQSNTNQQHDSSQCALIAHLIFSSFLLPNHDHTRAKFTISFFSSWYN